MTTGDPRTAALARLGFALAEETRVQILARLAAEPSCPSQLAEHLGTSRQVMSNQLAVLRGAGLVVGDRMGRRTCYRLARPDMGTDVTALLTLAARLDPA